MSYETYTCAQKSHPSFTERNNVENLYARGYFYLIIAGWKDTSTRILLTVKLGDSIAVRINCPSLLRRNYFDLRRSSIYVIFSLHGGKEATQLFMGQ